MVRTSVRRKYVEAFDNDSIQRIVLLVQRMLRWFGHAATRPEGELIKDPLLPTWRRRAGGQLKTWATTIKADLEPISGPRVFGHAKQRKDWVKVS